jgi:hypothetical protein
MSQTPPPLVSFRVGVLLLLVAVLWGWFDVRKRARTSDIDASVHKTDITVYTEAGAAMFDGRDPYLVSNPRGWHYLYPPILAIAMAPLALLPTTEQALVWYAFSCLWLVGCVVELRRLWRWRSAQLSSDQLNGDQDKSITVPTWLAWTVLAGVALPTLNCLQRGQVGVCLVYFLLLGARLVLCSSTKRGILLGGIVLALPVTIKLTPLLPAAVLAGGLLVQDLYRWLKQQSRPEHQAIMPRGVYATLGGIAGLIVWFLLVPAVTIGHTANIGHLRTWVARVVANDDVGQANDFNFKSKRNQSLDNGVRRLGNFLAYAAGNGPDDRLVDHPDELTQVPMPMETPTVDRAIKVAVLVFLMALGALVLRTAWQPSLAPWPAVFGLGCLATTVVSPLSWGHHFVMAAPALLFVPALRLRPSQPRAGMLLAGSGAALMAGHYVLLDIVGRIGLLGIGMSLWCAVAIALTMVQVQRQARQPQATISTKRVEEQMPQKRAA